MLTHHLVRYKCIVGEQFIIVVVGGVLIVKNFKIFALSRPENGPIWIGSYILWCVWLRNMLAVHWMMYHLWISVGIIQDHQHRRIFSIEKIKQSNISFRSIYLSVHAHAHARNGTHTQSKTNELVRLIRLLLWILCCCFFCLPVLVIFLLLIL